MLPLNGIKTHPLTEHGWAALEMLAGDPLPAQGINPGVVNRLLRENLVECYLSPTPYPTRRGRINWLRITAAGIQRLEGRQNKMPR